MKRDIRLGPHRVEIDTLSRGSPRPTIGEYMGTEK